MRTTLLTLLALIAFAANSLLCRMALKAEPGQVALLDPLTFTSLRLVSGALILAVILRWRGLIAAAPSGCGFRQSLRPATIIALFVYALCFSLAYVRLDTGTGALVLFGAVQLSMMLAAIAGGDRHPLPVWLGGLIAFAGLVYLLLPGSRAPSVAGVLLMSVAGIAWGAYSLLGRRGGDPMAATAWNFIGSVPMALLLMLGWWWLAPRFTTEGLVLALLSGALTSGLGYVLWYAVLPHLAAATAASLQLSVPVLAAAGGVILLQEAPTMRLLTAAVMVLGGIGLTIAFRRRQPGS